MDTIYRDDADGTVNRCAVCIVAHHLYLVYIIRSTTVRWTTFLTVDLARII